MKNNKYLLRVLVIICLVLLVIIAYVGFIVIRGLLDDQRRNLEIAENKGVMVENISNPAVTNQEVKQLAAQKIGDKNVVYNANGDKLIEFTITKAKKYAHLKDAGLHIQNSIEEDNDPNSVSDELIFQDYLNQDRRYSHLFDKDNEAVDAISGQRPRKQLEDYPFLICDISMKLFNPFSDSEDDKDRFPVDFFRLASAFGEEHALVAFARPVYNSKPLPKRKYFSVPVKVGETVDFKIGWFILPRLKDTDNLYIVYDAAENQKNCYVKLDFKQNN